MMVPQVMIPVTGKVETAEFAAGQHGPYVPHQVLAIAQCPISQGGLLVLGAVKAFLVHAVDPDGMTDTNLVADGHNVLRLALP
jgi:hypothetical protein